MEQLKNCALGATNPESSLAGAMQQMKSNALLAKDDGWKKADGKLNFLRPREHLQQPGKQFVGQHLEVCTEQECANLASDCFHHWAMC